MGPSGRCIGRHSAKVTALLRLQLVPRPPFSSHLALLPFHIRSTSQQIPSHTKRG